MAGGGGFFVIFQRGVARCGQALAGFRGETQQEQRVGIALFSERLGEIDADRVAAFAECIERRLGGSFGGGGLGDGSIGTEADRGRSGDDGGEGKGEQ